MNTSLYIAIIVILTLFSLYLFIKNTKARKNQKLKNNEVNELQISNTKLTTELNLKNEQLITERAMYSQMNKQMEDSFSHLAQKVLKGNNEQFLQMASQNFEKEGLKIKGNLDQNHAAIDNLVNPLKELIAKYQEHTSDLEKERQKSYFQVENELKKIAETHMQLSKETRALKTALKKPHVRGRWGEVQLKNCIELAGMSEHCDVSFQNSTTMEDGARLIPDMTVRMPGGRTVIVDAKTPLEAFLNTLELTDKEQLDAENLRHGQHVKKHIQQLSSKAYAQNLKDSADFTVMFLPNESFLYAALETQPDLVEYALEKKVLIATPPTLIGLLKVIRFGWNEEKLAENATRISEAGKELHKRICDFVEAFTGIGKHLDKAQEEYQKGLTRLESRVLVQTKRLEKLGAKSNKELPGHLLIEDSNDEDLLAITAKPK